MPQKRSAEVLRVLTPELPDLKCDVDVWSLANQLFLENCADRLTALTVDGSTRHKLLETATMSLDGLTYRLTLKKGWYFHCGAEVTANDAVATVQRVLQNERSASQLHTCIARDKAQKGGFAIRSVSRYRFEISLTRRMQDLLARLALPEFSLRHEGQPCFSGLWRVVELDPSGLLLAINMRHADAGRCEYEKVRWERLGTTPEIVNSLKADPYVYVYPGTYCKTPPQDLLADEFCKTLGAGYSVFVKVQARPDEAVDLCARIAAAARVCFGNQSLWRRAPLLALVPKGHVLHVPLQVASAWSDAFVAGTSKLPPAQLRLTSDIDKLPQRMWEGFRKIAAEIVDLDIQLDGTTAAGAPIDSAATMSPASAAASATLKVVYYCHESDFYTPLSQLPEKVREVLGKGTGEQSGKPSRAVFDTCRSLSRDFGYAPLLSVPLVLRSNRMVRVQDAGSSGLLYFADVRQSSERVRSAKQRDLALKALGVGLQMFVHDVKRPFSMVQGVLGLLEGATSPLRQREIAVRYLPDVRRSVEVVSRLIQDIMEIGSDAEPSCEDVSVREIIADVLRENFADCGTAAPAPIAFEYRLTHGRMLHCDPQKIARAVSNLVVNATEAMRPAGKIWFATSDDPALALVTLTVGNTNSFIAKEARAELFDRFFTEGKKHGTGLGLAIVKKIVNDHGGDVWCESEEHVGTAFTMTLPSSPAMDLTDDGSLPGNSQDLRSSAPTPHSEISLEGLRGLAGSAGHRILLVDDNPLYLAVVQELFTADERTAGKIAFHLALSVKEAWTALLQSAAAPFTIAIVDVDLGPSEPDGLGFVAKLRAQFPDLKLCVHSNGSPFLLQKKASEAGADIFLPKPMARDHLLGLLGSAVARSAGGELVPATRSATLRKIAICDDDALILETWEALPGYDWHSFSSPRELLERCSAEPEFIAQLLCVVTDYHFPSEVMHGVDLARELVRRRPGVPVFLATDRPMHGQELDPSLQALVPKEALQALALIERCSRESEP